MANKSQFRLPGNTDLGEGDALVSQQKLSSGAGSVLATNEFFQTHLAAFTTASKLTWNGSSWVSKPWKTFLAGSFQVKPVKVWNGASWITVS